MEIYSDYPGRSNTRDSDHIEFTSMPWGLTNSGREFQRLMDKLIRSDFRVEERVFKRNMKGECCDVFQDDALVYGKDEDILFEDTKELLERMYEARIPPKWEKCVFGVKEIEYGGYMINEEGIRNDPKKIEAFDNIHYPVNRKELESFLGLINYFREFIPRLASIIAPLEQLNIDTKYKKFYFLEEHKEVLDRCVEEVKKNIMLNYPKENGMLIVEVDACKLTYTVSAVLKQEQRGVEEVISVGSRKLRKEDAKKGIPYLEFSAIYFGATHFDNIIKGRKFKIRSDHTVL